MVLAEIVSLVSSTDPKNSLARPPPAVNVRPVSVSPLAVMVEFAAHS
jgi:hypothetical protein